MPGAVPDKPGLQAERTLLSWERSAFGFLVGGVLVLLRPHGPLGFGRSALAVVAGVLALVALWLGYRRSRRVNTGPGTVPAPELEVLVLGYSTAGFALVIVAALLFAP
jgi:uncharacterized membrane protein YidH (DUF202 family)